MNGLFPALDARCAQIALKTCLALVLNLAIALQLDWKPSFGAILIIVLQAPAVGATYSKGMLYIAGTLAGAVVGLIMVGLFAHDRVAFIAAMALVTGVGVYLIQTGRYPYAWLVFTITSMLVGCFSVQDPASAFGIAVSRASTICLAVVVMFLVHGLLWPMDGGVAFERQMQGFVEGCRDLLTRISRMAPGEGRDSESITKAALKQFESVAQLPMTLQAAAVDTERFGRFQTGYLELIGRLRELLLAITLVNDSVARRVATGSAADADAAALRSSLQAVADQVDALLGELSRPRDGTGPTSEQARPALAEADEPRTIAAANDASIRREVAEIASRVDRVRATLARVEDPAQASPPPPPKTLFSLTSKHFQKAAISSLGILLLGWFYIQTQWPLGLQLSMVFATIVFCVTSVIPPVLIGRQLLRSLVIGAAVAAPVYLWIMPGISQFTQLIPWLLLVFFPLFYLMATSKPASMLQHLFTGIFVMALLSLDEQRQSYSFSTFVNMWIGLCGGFGGALAILGLFSFLVPERQFSMQVRSFFTSCGEFLQRIRGSLRETPADAPIEAPGQQWQGAFKQLQMWSSASDYRRLPGNYRQQVEALIVSIGHLILRTTAVAHVLEQSAALQDPSLRRLLERICAECIESIAMIDESLASERSIPELPDTRDLLREAESRCEDLLRSSAAVAGETNSVIRFLSASSQLRLWLDAVHDFRDQANALDWRKWNANYF